MTESENEERPGGSRAKRGRANPVDVHVGSRVRMRRTLMGMSQERLGEALGLTFQQVQKYERGANRIGASRLYEIGKVLEVPVSYFFDDMPDDISAVPAPSSARHATTSEEQDRDPMAKRETLELVRAYYRIDSPKVRRRVFDLIKSLAQSD